jgi:plasmid stabilization system protein ParE
MTNTYRIFWSDESLKNLNSIIKYLELNWTEKEIKKFLDHLDKRIQLISKNPLIFPSTMKSRNIHKSVLSKQTSIFYRVSDNQIEILSIFDNRQDPNKLKI